MPDPDDPSADDPEQGVERDPRPRAEPGPRAVRPSELMPGMAASHDAGALPEAPAPPALEAPAQPERPAWTRTYEEPTARKIVSEGLQLVASSSGTIRRASIYIGLLTLGAFGPALVLLLVGVGRLLSDPTTAAALSADPYGFLVDRPEIVGPLLIIYLLVILGLMLLVAISIDAQAIAIALLGGFASAQPLHLREAVIRARQAFWRLAGAGTVVGIVSAVVGAVVTMPFLRPFDTNTGVTFIGSMIGALAVTPFAYAATGIVLGDVGAMETLRRSVSLFRARPRIAFVVVLFTLVTSAIQTFALSAGLDAAIRVAEVLDIGLDRGGLGLILPIILVLAFIVAFGSLTFTIAAIVAAPQVAAFLGLTFHSGGLDRARAVDGVPQRFRWVTLPMLASMIGLVIIGVLGLPTVAGF